MSHFDNETTTPLSPMSYREARQRMRAFKGDVPPIPQIDTLIYTDPYWHFDLARLVREDSALVRRILESPAEDNGDIILPPEIEEDLVRRGYIFWVDDGEGK